MPNHNPFTPSAVDLSTQSLLPQTTIKLVGHKVRSAAFRIFNENLWPLNGLALLSIFMQSSAGAMGLGAIIIPHLYAGTTLAGYRYYKKQGDIDAYFDGFRSFGQVLLIGLAFLPFILIVGVAYGLVLLVAYWASNTDSSLVVLSTLLMLPIAGLLILYVRARWILAFPLAVYFDQNAGEALRKSWQLTEESGLTITLNLLLFEGLFMFLGLLLLCIGIIPASGLVIAAHGAITGQLLDAAFPDTDITDQFSRKRDHTNREIENSESSLPAQNEPKSTTTDFNPYG